MTPTQRDAAERLVAEHPTLFMNELSDWCDDAFHLLRELLAEPQGEPIGVETVAEAVLGEDGPKGYATWREAAMAERMRSFKERQKLAQWLVKNGMLVYHARCRRSDGSNGPAWVLLAPHIVNGDSCEAWSAGSAADLLREFLRADGETL